MRFTAQLVQALHLRMSGAEIAQEVASSPAVVTSGFGTERRAEGIDRASRRPEPEDVGAEGVARGS